VKEVLKKMKAGKAIGPYDIPIEVWRCLGDIAIVWLTKLSFFGPIRCLMGGVRRIQESEVKEVLKKMKPGKTIGPDDIPIEVWRCFGDITIMWLTKLFNIIFRSNKMSDEWRRSILVPIFKNKGDIQSCTNYRGIKLMSHTMKL
jgi:hypothetical protein